MKLLLKALLIPLLIFSFMPESTAQTENIPTVREAMQMINERFDVTFIYDSSLDLDIPCREVKKEDLLSIMRILFKDTCIEYEISGNYIILTRKKGSTKPEDYSAFIKEQHDTIAESIITSLNAKERNRTRTGFRRIESEEFEQGFSVLSSPDVIKTLQQLPGVAAGTELLSGLHVRGGVGADNLYLLDGVPLYQTGHLLGLFSSFNTDVTESVDFYKSGFPSQYGGRLSSVVDIRTREGDMKEYHGMAAIGLLDGRLQVEGPVAKDRTSFNIGLRRSWIDILTEPALLIANLVNDTDVKLKYAFWDMNGNLTHKFSDRSRMSVNLYGSRDAAKIVVEDPETDLAWGNILGSVNWSYQLADNHELESKIYYSRNYSHFSFEELEHKGVNSSSISDIGFKADLHFRPSDHHDLRYGGVIKYQICFPEYQTEDMKESDRKKSVEAVAYIEDEMNLTRWLTANIGMRYSAIMTGEKAYHSLEPRAALLFRYGDNTSMKLSYSEMTQNNHLISSNYLNLPTSFWMPSTSVIPPGRSRQTSAGIYFNLPYGIRFNAEGWFKTMDNLLEFRGKWGIYPPVTFWEKNMSIGKGRSWGLETELSWSDEKTSVTAFYTLSWNFRKFEDFFPDWYRDRNDNRHKLTITATRKLGRHCDVYASWNFHSGGWITAESHEIVPEEIGGSHEIFFEMPNNIKIPDYHRLDIGFNFRKITKRGNESIWNLSLYNAYCSMNPLMVYLDYGYEFTKENISGLKYVGEAFGLIPIIPSFSYTLKF